MMSNDEKLDRLLREAADSENESHVDADRFLQRLRPHIQRVRRATDSSRPLWWSVAAIVPLALLLWALAPWSVGSSVDAAILEEFDILEILAALDPTEIATLEPELIELYADLEIVEELPVDLLEVSE